MCAGWYQSRTFLCSLVDFQHVTGTSVTIVTYDEHARRVIRNGLTHAEFVQHLQHTISAQLQNHEHLGVSNPNIVSETSTLFVDGDSCEVLNTTKSTDTKRLNNESVANNFSGWSTPHSAIRRKHVFSDFLSTREHSCGVLLLSNVSVLDIVRVHALRDDENLGDKGELVPHADGAAALNLALRYLEQQATATPADIMFMTRWRNYPSSNRLSSVRQKTIT
ncbi:hypothetical protein J6590_037019 [Homalodisca vitripennis]|nr:hypothetical protein J6590_037019 [Homalodisca vitripennis]